MRSQNTTTRDMIRGSRAESTAHPLNVLPLSKGAATIRSRVDSALNTFFELQASELGHLGSDIANLVEKIRGFVLSPGKRIRPTLCYWGWRGANASDDETIIKVAASLEMFHAFALIHDDIMDASDLRRGKPAMHRQFVNLHNRSGWQGSAEFFGAGAGILAGDLCMIWADTFLHQCGLAAETLAKAQPVLQAMRAEMAAGQYLDLVEQASADYSIVKAATVLCYKSAKYTVERPLHIGGVLADAGPELLASYSAFGIPVGEAFQLRDDVLGVFGNPEVTGKPNSDDLREGKQTVLTALAWQRASAKQRARIHILHGNPELDEEGCAELRKIIAATGALASVETMIAERTWSALNALEEAPIPRDVYEPLHELAEAITNRHH